jgi:hypothetical protein
MSGLETMHDSIPLVIQPTVDVAPRATGFGFAVSAMRGVPICTLHCAPVVPALLPQLRTNVAVFAPCGGWAIVTFDVPES